MKCHIAEMLRAQKKHVSFHTPGHKRAGWDITELSYSDNLSSPHGVIARAEADIAGLLGAEKSFILTDGSTCGVLSALYALKTAGARSVAFSAYSHKSVKNGCTLLGLRTVVIPAREIGGIPQQPSEDAVGKAVKEADALLLTSPDYYGNFAPLSFAREACDRAGKPLVVDGAHGAHLRFCPQYAGNFADIWVDGVHKSLPARTQGAVVSAKSAFWAEKLRDALDIFRTTSPSYPVMASVEYAVKYPRNEKIERAAQALKARSGAYGNGDWSKIVVPFGSEADGAQRFLEAHGAYPEFNDGNCVMFYLSPCTKKRELKKLGRLLKGLPRGTPAADRAEKGRAGKSAELVPLSEAVGRTCARDCGTFPPCLPLVCEGERVTEERAERLSRARHVYGLTDGKILVYTEE